MESNSHGWDWFNNGSPGEYSDFIVDMAQGYEKLHRQKQEKADDEQNEESGEHEE